MAIMGLTDSPGVADDSGRDSAKRNCEGPGDNSGQGHGKNRRGRGRGNKGNGENRQHHTGNSRGGTRDGPSDPLLGAPPPAE